MCNRQRGFPPPSSPAVIFSKLAMSAATRRCDFSISSLCTFLTPHLGFMTLPATRYGSKEWPVMLSMTQPAGGDHGALCCEHNTSPQRRGGNRIDESQDDLEGSLCWVKSPNFLSKSFELEEACAYTWSLCPAKSTELPGFSFCSKLAVASPCRFLTASKVPRFDDPRVTPVTALFM